MGLKMVHGFKVHKGKNYSRLDAIDFLLTLSFEGVVPIRVCGFPDLNYKCFKGYRDFAVLNKSRRNEVETPFFGASSTNKNKDLRQM